MKSTLEDFALASAKRVRLIGQRRYDAAANASVRGLDRLAHDENVNLLRAYLQAGLVRPGFESRARKTIEHLTERAWPPKADAVA